VIITKCEALQPHVVARVQRLIDEGGCGLDGCDVCVFIWDGGMESILDGYLE
jgi:hypothetical protein